MFETGIEGHYALVDGKKLRYGYTTGTCAAAAAKGAALLLLTGRAPAAVKIHTPKGIDLTLPMEEAKREGSAARCAVRKFSGDDPDVTDGALIVATASVSAAPGVHVDGGEGVGRVTKPGLKVPVGEAAINPGPRSMIERAVQEALEETEPVLGLDVVISVPEGAALAQKTFNPRLGILGGISILGTSGIVEPMSEEALIDSIRLEIRQRKALGETRLILAPGNYGTDFLRDTLGVSEDRIVKISNYVGRALDAAAEAGFAEVLLAGHIGKLVKIAGNMMNTHSKYGDCRMEILGSAAAAFGVKPETAEYILGCAACDEAVRVLREEGIDRDTLDLVSSRIEHNLDSRAFKACEEGQEFETGAIMFSKEYGLLGETGKAQELLGRIITQYGK